MFHTFGKVDSEDINGDPSDRCATDHHGAMPLEMISPKILPRVKQASELPSCRVKTGDVRAFVRITSITTESKVFFNRRTVVFLSKDVIHLKREHIVRLRYVAVFADGIRSLPDESA